MILTLIVAMLLGALILPAVLTTPGVDDGPE